MRGWDYDCRLPPKSRELQLSYKMQAAFFDCRLTPKSRELQRDWDLLYERIYC